MKFTFEKELYIKRAIFALLVVLAALLQHTAGSAFSIGYAKAWILVPLVVAISMYEKSVVAMLFGVFAGILWDFASVSGDGFFAIVLCVCGFVCSMLVSFIIRNNLPACLILTFFSLLFCTAVHWFGFVFLRGIDGSFAILIRYYLSSAAFSMLFSPVFYYLIGAISRAFKSESRHSF